jgi:hypothetical protein
MRYFRSSDAVLEQVRLSLDAAWGLPANGQITTLLPAADSPHDPQGRVLLAVRNEFCEYEAVAAMLPQLLAAGVVEEISEAEYMASLPPPQI